MLSSNALKRLQHALADQAAGREVADAVNKGSAAAQSATSGSSIAAVIVATSVSTTTDFGALKAGDKLVHIPAVAGNADFESVVTAGTKPSAAVVGDLYIALRAWSAPASSTKL